MSMQFSIFSIIRITIMTLETIILIGLLVGWLLGARKLNLKVHHRAVYPLTVLHVLTVGLWMIPRAIEILASDFSGNPIVFFSQISHDLIGFLALISGSIVIIVVLIKKELDLDLLRKLRPLMFLTILSWTISYILGIFLFLEYLI